jgi:imidazolonepropionase-like amidohydrolase
LATKPDFVKAILVYSEEFERRKNDPKCFSRRGLDPKLLPLIVQKARESGLRVVVHVESAADFHVAVAAGVNQIAHMPGFWPSDEAIAQKSFDRYRISETDARVAGKKHIQVTTTLGERLASLGDPEMKDVASALLDVYRSNLSLLEKNKVEILIGSDQFFSNCQGEAVELVRSGLMSAQEALHAWCEITPRAIFPDRKIGKIKDGYEANLMVLAADPLTDFHRGQRCDDLQAWS